MSCARPAATSQQTPGDLKRCDWPLAPWSPLAHGWRLRRRDGRGRRHPPPSAGRRSLTIYGQTRRPTHASSTLHDIEPSNDVGPIPSPHPHLSGVSRFLPHHVVKRSLAVFLRLETQKGLSLRPHTSSASTAAR